MGRNGFKKALWILACFFLSVQLQWAFSSTLEADEASPIATSTVGVARQIDQLVLPGDTLEVRPLADRNEPFVLRIVAIYPHGTDHRYDFEFYALEPGTYNLTDYLVRANHAEKTASASVEPVVLPSVFVQVDSTLPAGQIAVAPLTATQVPWLGGYRLMWFGGGLLWLGGLYALLFFGRKKRESSQIVPLAKTSLADQLRPLVHSAIEGKLPPEQRAALERTLIAFWCLRLKLGSMNPAQAMIQLRQHPEAGPLLRSLEEWLHRPDPPQSVDVERLLKPYSEVTDVQLDLESPKAELVLPGAATV